MKKKMLNANLSGGIQLLDGSQMEYIIGGSGWQLGQCPSANVNGFVTGMCVVGYFTGVGGFACMAYGAYSIATCR
jgi:hypothetical protein